MTDHSSVQSTMVRLALLPAASVVCSQWGRKLKRCSGTQPGIDLGRYFVIMALVVLAVACASRSPFTRSPADLAIEKPCRFMGSLHKESRVRIEALRMCRAISHDEWLCMARVLETIDNEFTGRCRSRAVRYAEVANEQRRRYSNCFDTPRTEVVECGILSTESERPDTSLTL